MKEKRRSSRSKNFMMRFNQYYPNKRFMVHQLIFPSYSIIDYQQNIYNNLQLIIIVPNILQITQPILSPYTLQQIELIRTSMFSITPPSLHFSHFRPGHPQLQSIMLYNNTNQPISFYLSFPSPHAPSFDCQFSTNIIPPKQHTEATIIFIPQLYQEIKCSAVIYFEGEHTDWKEEVEIECRMKRVSLGCKREVLDFGEVVLGEKRELWLGLENGNKDTVRVLFQNRKGKLLSNTEELEESQQIILSQLKFPYELIVSEQNQQILISYLPTVVGPFSLPLQFIIVNNLFTTPQQITIQGSCIDLPLYLQRTQYDMKICIIGHFYKEQIVIHNRYQESLKIQISQPRETKKYIEFVPNIGFIQKQSKLSIWFRLNILKDIETSLGDFFAGDAYVLPFILTSKNQTIPIEFNIKFKITTNKLEITPKRIDFGNIYQGTGSKISILLRNESILFQEVMLFPSTNNIHILHPQPIKILPKQELSCQLLYVTSSSITQQHKQDQQIKRQQTIKCEVITGDVLAHEINLNTICTIIKPYLELQVNKINFPVMQSRESFNTEIKMKNNSDEYIVFEIFLPPEKICGLKISPMVKVLEPKEVINLNVQYQSFFKTLDLEKLNEIETRKSFNFIDKLTNYILNNKYFGNEVETVSTSPEEYIWKMGGKYSHFNQIQHFQWLIPIYFKQKQYPDASAEVTFLEITTTTCNKFLELSQTEIDFGDIPVGVKATKELTLKNLKQQTEISKIPLPVWCGFKVVNTFKTLNTNEIQTINVEFLPNDQRSFCQKLVIQSDKTEVSCILKGKGIRPQLLLYPEDGFVNMGAVLINEYSIKKVKIKNEKSFETYFRLNLRQEGMRNGYDRKAFSYIPQEGYVPALGEIEIEIRFSPNRGSDKYYQYLEIKIPQQNDIVLYVSGESKPNQPYISLYNPLALTTPPLSSLPKVQNNSLLQSPEPQKILLLFHNQPDTSRNKIRIGNCLRTQTQHHKYRFQIDVPRDSFKCSEYEGEVGEGEEVIVEIENIFKECEREMRIAVLEEIRHTVDVVASVRMWREEGERVVGEEVYEMVLRTYFSSL